MEIGYFPTFYETVNIEYLWMSLRSAFSMIFFYELIPPRTLSIRSMVFAIWNFLLLKPEH